MSLPLRHALENVTSPDRVLEDLLVRFIINCPPEDLSSVERELFHFEEASWFYTDFVKIMNPTLPSLKIKSFAQNVIRLCPLVWKWDIKADEALQKFSQYKKSIPVRGAAIFNEKLSKILLVQGTESDSWSFPRGKISKDEDDVACCIREVREEIGFDITDYIDENQFIERNIQGKNYKIYIVSGVPENYLFKPQVRNEIAKIEWRDFKKMSRTMSKSNVKYYLVNSMMRPLSMWLRRQKQIVGDDQLKSYAEEQLKLLLGITKEEQVDPGRELLNMLHTAVQSNEDKTEPSQALSDNISNDTAQIAPTLMMPTNLSGPPPPAPGFSQPFGPLMGFQPFAPFPFVNGSMKFISPQMVPSGMPPLHPMTQMPHGNGGIPIPTPENVLPTPDVSSLSKPVFAQQQTASSPSTSKQLLDLLKTRKKEESSTIISTNAKPKVTILKREHPKMESEDTASADLLNIIKGSGTTSEIAEKNQLSNSSDSETLLKILKRPAQHQNNKEFTGTQRYLSDNYAKALDEEASLLDEITNRESEGFEDSSNNEIDEDENEIRRQPFDTSSGSNKNGFDNDEYEDFESSSEADEEDELEEVEREEKPPLGSTASEVLKENRFKDGDVPHKDEYNESAASTDGKQASADSTKPKPKFKLLKRGENLNDILPDSQPVPSSPLHPAAIESLSNNPLLDILRRAPVDDNQTHQQAPVEFEKQQSPEEELMGMLNKNKNPNRIVPEINQMNSHVSPQLPSTNLLDFLKNGPPAQPGYSETTNNIQFSSPQDISLNDNGTGGINSQAASSELLGILKRPSNSNATQINANVRNISSPHEMINDPLLQGTAYNKPASNELLNILHRR